MPNQYTSDLVKRDGSTNQKSKSKYFFFGFLAVSSIVAFLVGGYFIGKDKANKDPNIITTKDDVNITPFEIPNDPDKWTAYEIKAVDMEIKLPDKLVKLGDWKEYEKEGEKGSIVCFSIKLSEGASCSGEALIIGGSSTDFEEGREGLFTDLQGFTKENGIYFVKTVGGNKFELKDAKFKEFGNENGVEIIKILGENQTVEGNELPVAGTPGEGYLGAIINTKNKKYPGLSIQLDLNSDISEFEFDQILKSLKFTN